MALKPFDGKLDEVAEQPRRVRPFTGTLDDVVPPASAEKGVTGHLQDLGLSALKGAIGVPELAVGLADIPTGGRVGRFLENEGGLVGFRPKEAKNILSEFHTDQYKAQQQEFQEADGVLDKAGVALSNPSLIANVVTESVPAMLGGGVVGQGIRRVAPKVSAALAGAAGEGTVMAGSQAAAIRQETDDGLLTPGQSGAALGTGAVGALFGFAGGRLAQKMGIGDVDTMLARGVTPEQVAGELAATPAKSIPRRVIEGAITEGFLEELPQSVSEQVIQNLALGRNWAEGVEDAAVMGTLAGMAMGGAANVRSAAGSSPAEAVDAPETLALPAPEPAAESSGGVLSRAAAKLPAPEPVLGLPAPEPAMYVDSEGNAQSIGPVRNVDGEMRPEPQARVPMADPAASTGGRGMYDQAPVGESPNVGTAEDVRVANRQRQAELDQERADRLAAAYVDEANRAAAEIIQLRREQNQPDPEFTLPRGLELADKDNHGRWLNETYRSSVQALIAQLEKGGGVAYVRDANDRITGRTPSSNPKWWQDMDASVKPGSVEEGRRIVDKALEGKSLGPKQARFVAAMMDIVDDIRLPPQQAEQNRAILQELEWAASGEAARNQADLERGAVRDYGTSEQDDAELYAYLSGKVEPFSLKDLTPDESVQVWNDLQATDQPVLDDTSAQTAEAGAGGEIETDFKGVVYGSDQGAVETGGEVPAREGVPGDRQGLREDSGTVSSGRQPDSFQLETQTEEQLAARAEALRLSEKADDEAGRQEEQRVDADRQRETFNLTGSDRAADVAAASGQTDLLSGSQPESKPAEEFVLTSDGSVNFGEITADMAKVMGRQAGKIRLQQGVQNSDGTGYGLAHIEANHGEQIRGAGYESVEQFVSESIAGMDSVWSPGKTTQLVALQSSKKGQAVFIQLQPAVDEVGDYYRINTAFPVSGGYAQKREKRGWKKLWSRDPVPADASGAPGFAGQTSQAGEAAPVVSPQSDVSVAQPKGSSEPDKIEDAGEKLGGARKDELRSVRDRLENMDDEAIASSTLSELWPKGEVDKIDDPFHAAAYWALRSEIPAKPRVAYKLKRWVTKIKEARLTLGYLASLGADVSLAELRKASPALRSFANKVELLAAVERSQWPRVGRVQHNTGRYLKDGEMVPGSWFDVEIDKRRRAFYGHDTMSSALPEIKSKLAPETAPVQEMKFAIYRGRNSGQVFIAKDGDKEKRHLKEFEDVKSARAFLQDNHAKLVEAWEAVKNRDNVTKSDMRRGINAQRVGQDYREGKDITPEQFLEAFGFRGVEFGNWVGQGKGGRERQGMLNEAFDALMDLAGIIGVPPKAISLEGTLGIGFGSRGKGGRAAAHFEPGTVVINLTKTQGAGSLAHEWFHALDNYFARKRTSPIESSAGGSSRDEAFITYRPEPMYINKKYPTMRATKAEVARRQIQNGGAPIYAWENWEVDPAHPKGVRPQVEKAFAELVSTLNASPMLQRSVTIDGGKSNGYWSRIIERGARSFETYVIAKLADRGARNDFLANVVTLEDFARAPDRYPYLTADEQGPVSEAFDKLFATVETTEVDGKIAMFSRKGRGRTTGQALSKPELQGIVDDFLSRFKGADDVRVQIHDSAETLPSYRADRDSGSSIQGEYDFRTGTVHLVGASLGARDGKSAREVVEETLREEILVHKGLGLLSPVARRQLYAQIKKASTENPAIKKLWDQTVADYGDVAKVAKLTSAQADRFYAEEMLGTLAQRKINWATKGWNRIMRALKRLAVRAGLIKHTDGPAELIKAVEYIADSFAKGRRARARNLTTDVRADDAGLPAFRMASTAQGAAQAREVLDRALGRAKLDPTDPFAAENRRLREEDRPIWDKAKKIFARQFAPGGLLPGDVFSEKIKRDSEFEAVEFDVRHMVGALEKAVQGDYGLAANKLTEDQMRSLSEALAGKVDDSLPTNTRAGIVAMRQYIDRLSTEYIGILQQQVADRLKGSDQALINKITGNLGSYVHRSYQAYDDPKWFKKVPTATLNAARNYLAAGYRRSGESSAEAARLADVTVNEILKSGTAYDSLESFIAEGKLGAKDRSVLMKRKDVAPQIRALLGEHVDPRVNFAKSATKMGRLIWNQRFLDRVREVGMGAFLFEGKNRPADATTQIAGEQSETYSPLNGLWTFPEVAQAFKDALGKEQMGDLYRTVVRLNGMVKYGKTVLSPTTAMRNWQSAMFFSLANGHFNLQHMRKSMAAFREQVSQSATGDDLAYLRKLKQLGVVYDSPYAGEMMRLLEDARMDELLSGKSGKALSVFRKANQMAQGFYTFGDDFWKIIGFENEKASLRDAGFSETEAETMAAERIRNTYPTYSMVGRGMRWLSRFPLAGTFVSFPSEIVRTSANMLRTVAADLKSDNPKLRELGRKRAAGMALVSGGFYALSAMTAAALGVDDDEEEAIRDLGPPWQDNSTFMYLGRDPDGKLRYVDLSFLDPYGYWKRPVTAMLRNQPWEESAKSGVADMLTPFLGGDITAQAIFEVMANKKASGGQVYRENGEALDQLTDIANHMRKTIQPGFISNAERFVKAASGERREGSGQPYSVRDEVSALLGWRASTLDARTGLYYRSFDFNQALTDARSSLNRVLRSANAVDIDDIRTAKQGAERMNSKAFNEMARLVKAAESAGMSRREILQTLTLGGVSRRNAAALIRGQVPNLDIGGQARSRAVRQARVTQGPEQAREIARRYREVLAL
jgi:hypothetical protein